MAPRSERVTKEPTDAPQAGATSGPIKAKQGKPPKTKKATKSDKEKKKNSTLSSGGRPSSKDKPTESEDLAALKAKTFDYVANKGFESMKGVHFYAPRKRSLANEGKQDT